MISQLTLFEDAGRRQTFLEEVDPNECVVDPLNVRQERLGSDVDELAKNIGEEGYDLTRAVWARRNDKGVLSVFAGGTRLEAAQKVGVNISVILHEGYTDDELVHLTDLDNVRDARHKPVSAIQVWAHYAYLAQQPDWTQQRIADAKGVSKSLVSERIKWHGLSDSIKSYVLSGDLTEMHIRHITSVVLSVELSLWLITEQAWSEIAKWACGHTVKETKKKVGQWKKFIQLAEDYHQELREEVTLYDLGGDEPKAYRYAEREEFVAGLVEREARSQAKVKEAKREVTLFVAESLKDYKVWVEAAEVEEARKAVRARREQELLAKFRLGDFREEMRTVQDNSVDLIFTDLPYAEEYVSYYGDLAEIAARVLKPNGSLIVYTGHYALPQVFELVCPHLTYWWQLIVKHMGGAARLPGKWVFVEYKPLLWFVKGGRRDKEYVSDFIYSSPPDKKDIEWEQSVVEARYCIERLTDEGDLVVDPFCGSGTTVIAAASLKRDFWTCDISDEKLDLAKERLLEWHESALIMSPISV